MTGDRTQRSQRVGWEFVHSIVDDCSRMAYSEIHDDEKALTVTAFVPRALEFLSEHGVAAERLMTDNAVAYVHNQSLHQLLDRCGSPTSAPGPTSRVATATSRDTSRPSNASGPTRRTTPQATPDATRCHTGRATTTSDAPTPRSVTALPSNAFGRSPGVDS